jgi:enoyl-CoA hydratase
MKDAANVAASSLAQDAPKIHAAQDAPKIEVRRTGACVSFVLNRPKALNAFDDDMRRIIADEIPRISRNPDVYVVVLQSSSPRAFCAGGDVRALTREARDDPARVAGYFAGEYSLNWRLDCFSKPTVSLINGLCMGSGAGLSLYNTHRVAGENYSFAMPETGIGLFPDVGVAHRLARLPWPVGLYLGLTGRAIGRGDAHWLGLATHCADQAEYPRILRGFADGEPIDPLLDDRHQPQPPGLLQLERPMIEAFFSQPSIHEIVRALEQATGASTEWAQKTLAGLRKCSPLSLAITDRHIRAARTLDLRETLIQDYRLAVKCLNGRDFYEGVRAALVDKDGKPVWSPARIEDVSEAFVAAYFEPLEAGELNLATRSEMQASRV